jgi:hypothetical protein
MAKCGTNAAASQGAVRYLRKTTNAGERALYSNYWKEQINLYGTFVDYFPYNYRLSAHDFIYGEQPTAEFAPSKGMVMLAEFHNDSLMLAKFGIQTDADVTFIIHIQSFREVWGPTAEPKAGDVIRMTELGWDRPGGVSDPNTVTEAITSCEQLLSGVNSPLDNTCRQAAVAAGVSAADCSYFTDSRLYTAYDDGEVFDKLLRGAPTYEITERRDENMTMQYNQLQGHYVWIIHAKRFDYSYQPNAPREPGSDQVGDDTMYGKLSGGTLYPENPRKYPQNIEDESNKEWDYKKESGDDPSVYGDY